MRILFLCSTELSTFHMEVINNIIQSKRHSVVNAIIDLAPKRSSNQKIRHNIRKGRGGYIIVMAFKKFFNKKRFSVNTKIYFERIGVPVYTTELPYDEQTLIFIKQLNVEVFVYCGGFGYMLKKPIIDLAPNGVLSYHHGDMRKYRGQPAGFWELFNGETEMGATVQKLSVSLDKGIPIVEKSIKIHKTDSYKKLKGRLYRDTSNMMLEALDVLSKDDLNFSQIEKFGKLYTLPNFHQWMIFVIKILLRRLKVFIG